MVINTLRKCRECGKEAKFEDELRLFCKNDKCQYGRDNLCKVCYNEHQRKGGKWYRYRKKYRERRITFKDDRIQNYQNPRKNICELCNKEYPTELKTQTHLHHYKYDKTHPLKFTIELCNSCHVMVHNYNLNKLSLNELKEALNAKRI